FYLRPRVHPHNPLFPYTTLFRSGKSEVMNVIGDVEGKRCILIDDIVDSGGTLCNAAEALLAHGATEVMAYITHGVLSGGAVSRIDRKSTRLNSSHVKISYAVFCL